MYQALYRTYRPEVFEEVLGQEHIVRILQNQLETDTVGHAYLFCGTRGTGKTTMARLLAKGVNCLAEGKRPCGHCANCMAIKNGTFMDVIEIDAASNNSVDNIRELRESVKYPPAEGRKKVYIIDEVHMLSQNAFNALLKTLEEPPENVIFILATTEPQKVIQTIISRCLRLDFRRVPEKTIAKGMAKICADMGIEVTEGALNILAANADGSVRDGLSILDQCLSGGEKKITREDVIEFLGAAGEEVFVELTDFVLLHKIDEALLLLDKVLADGKDVVQFTTDWLAHYRSLLITKFVKNPEEILNRSTENIERIRTQSARLDLSEINQAIVEIAKTLSDIKKSTQTRVLLELCVIKLANGAPLQQTGSFTANFQPTAQAAHQPTGHSAARPAEQFAAAHQPVEERHTSHQESVGSGSGINCAAQGADEVSAKPAAAEKADHCGSTETEKAEHGRSTTDDAELEKLWYRILEQGEDIQASINTIRDTKLLSVDERTFTVLADPSKKMWAERMGPLLEELMEKHAGKHLAMELVTSQPAAVSKTEEGKKSGEELAKEIGGILGLSVEVGP